MKKKQVDKKQKKNVIRKKVNEKSNYVIYGLNI